VSTEFSAQHYAMMARLVPGSQLAGYVIEEQAGAGGMAVVFRARDGVLGRLAALKVLSPALAADQEFRARFLRESRAVASVEEPHIIPVYGAGEVDGVLYIATKFVAGGDLAAVLERAGGALDPGRAVTFIEQVASALDAAHAAGLVHRDVKPGNILVDVVPGRAEHAYLSDFGLSKRSMATSGLTATGTFLGTPDYCAPEQIRGLPVDGRGDQYSLACMAFALLTGNLPFRRQESMATLFAHLNDPVPPLSRYRSDLPSATDAVLARGLAKEPRDRYGRCGEFAAALRDSLTGAGYSAPRAARPPHVPETAVWSGSASGAVPATETFTAPASSPAPSGAARSAVWPSPPGSTPHTAPPAPAAPAAPAASQRTWAAQPPPVGGRPITRPAPPPPAAGQGGKLPLISKSAVIAVLAAAAALLLLFMLNRLGLSG
jgi:serine/threonine protein kinase